MNLIFVTVTGAPNVRCVSVITDRDRGCFCESYRITLTQNRANSNLGLTSQEGLHEHNDAAKYLYLSYAHGDAYLSSGVTTRRDYVHEISQRSCIRECSPAAGIIIIIIICNRLNLRQMHFYRFVKCRALRLSARLTRRRLAMKSNNDRRKL